MQTRCGYVAIIGSPNAGKSTLFNRLIGQKLSSVSFKPQTTRHRILGVRTETDAQFVFVDTPGIHLSAKKLINRVLNKNATNALQDVHLIFWVIDVTSWTQEEEHIKNIVKDLQQPIILVVNKIDKLTQREILLSFLNDLPDKDSYNEIVPIAALKKENLEELIKTSKNYLPESEFFFSNEYLTDRNDEFIIAESIRETLFIYLEKELPYATHVEIENMRRHENQLQIDAAIWVEKNSQKGIVIGHKGEMLKKIGTRARESLQRQLQEHLHLQLWVKVKEDWQNNPQVVGQYES